MGDSYSPLYLRGEQAAETALVRRPARQEWYEQESTLLTGLEEYQMRRMLFLPLLAALVGVTVYGQQRCEFDITGTWKMDTSDMFYRFEPNGSLSVLVPSSEGTSSEVRETARAVYKLDNPKAPKVITVTAANEGGVFAPGTTSVEITDYDETTLTVKSVSGPVRWVRADLEKFFIVFAGREGTIHDGGPAFAILIKTDGRQSEIETIGLYFEDGRKKIGSVPRDLVNQFMKESRTESDVMLRLEITKPQFERSLKIAKTWQRRGREDALLYSGTRYAMDLDNSVLLREIAESLNRCGERIKLYKLTWRIDDEVAVNYRAPHVAFQYFRRLKELNETLHIPDEKFSQVLLAGK